MIEIKAPKLTFWRVLLAAIWAAGVYAILTRFTNGLGSVTHLSDEFPWGLWIGFDVLCGVALAAGGFTITAAAYLFGFEECKPIVRSSTLTAFLGYLLVCFALLVDLGKPYNIWHPLVMWNPHSVMFEVAWCVMLYTTVLALESSLFVFEKLRLSKFYSLVKSVTFVLVLIGVILSTLHQSSLGSLFLIVPAKLSPLWYTPLLPLLFYVSAIATGLAMVIVESHLSHRAFDRELESGLTVKIARISAWVLAIYFALKMTEVIRLGAFPLVLRLNYPSLLFLLEIGVGIALPLVIFTVPRLRSSKNGLFIYGLSVVLGLVINRLNVSITGFESLNGRRYTPSWQELAVSVALVGTGVFIFYTASRFLPIFSRRKFTVESVRNT